MILIMLCLALGYPSDLLHLHRVLHEYKFGYLKYMQYSEYQQELKNSVNYVVEKHSRISLKLTNSFQEKAVLKLGHDLKDFEGNILYVLEKHKKKLLVIMHEISQYFNDKVNLAQKTDFLVAFIRLNLLPKTKISQFQRKFKVKMTNLLCNTHDFNLIINHELMPNHVPEFLFKVCDEKRLNKYDFLNLPWAQNDLQLLIEVIDFEEVIQRTKDRIFNILKYGTISFEDKNLKEHLRDLLNMATWFQNRRNIKTELKKKSWINKLKIWKKRKLITNTHQKKS